MFFPSRTGGDGGAADSGGGEEAAALAGVRSGATGKRPSAERKRSTSAWDRGAAGGLLVGIMLCSCRAHTWV